MTITKADVRNILVKHLGRYDEQKGIWRMLFSGIAYSKPMQQLKDLLPEGGGELSNDDLRQFLAVLRQRGSIFSLTRRVLLGLLLDFVQFLDETDCSNLAHLGIRINPNELEPDLARLKNLNLQADYWFWAGTTFWLKLDLLHVKYTHYYEACNAMLTMLIVENPEAMGRVIAPQPIWSDRESTMESWVKFSVIDSLQKLDRQYGQGLGENEQLNEMEEYLKKLTGWKTWFKFLWAQLRGRGNAAVNVLQAKSALSMFQVMRRAQQSGYYDSGFNFGRILALVWCGINDKELPPAGVNPPLSDADITDRRYNLVIQLSEAYSAHGLPGMYACSIGQVNAVVMSLHDAHPDVHVDTSGAAVGSRVTALVLKTLQDEYASKKVGETLDAFHKRMIEECSRVLRRSFDVRLVTAEYISMVVTSSVEAFVNGKRDKADPASKALTEPAEDPDEAAIQRGIRIIRTNMQEELHKLSDRMRQAVLSTWKFSGDSMARRFLKGILTQYANGQFTSEVINKILDKLRTSEPPFYDPTPASDAAGVGAMPM